MIDNEGFNSLKDFGVMDGDKDVQDMEKRLVSRAVATCMDLGTVKIQGIQDPLVWWIHYFQTHNQPLIAAEFGQVAKRAEMTRKRI